MSTKGEPMSDAEVSDTVDRLSETDGPPDSDTIQRVAQALEATEAGPATEISGPVDGAGPPLPPRRR